jgi:hypothetical protein
MKAAEKIVLYIAIAVVAWVVIDAVISATQSTTTAANDIGGGFAAAEELVGWGGLFAGAGVAYWLVALAL